MNMALIEYGLKQLAGQYVPLVNEKTNYYNDIEYIPSKRFIPLQPT